MEHELASAAADAPLVAPPEKIEETTAVMVCICLHGGWDNLVENNILVDGGLCQLRLNPMMRDCLLPSLKGLGARAPGPVTTVGTRMPPSQAEPLPPFSGPFRMKPPPLSDVKIT